MGLRPVAGRIWAALELGRNGLNPTRLAACPLLNQEQIQGRKNAPVARFDGLCCYQSRSETNGALGGSRRKKRLAARQQTGAEKHGFKQPRRKRACAKPGSLRKQGRRRTAKSRWGLRLGQGWGPGRVWAGFRAEHGLICRLPALESGANSRPQKRPCRTV